MLNVPGLRRAARWAARSAAASVVRSGRRYLQTPGVGVTPPVPVGTANRHVEGTACPEPNRRGPTAILAW